MCASQIRHSEVGQPLLTEGVNTEAADKVGGLGAYHSLGVRAVINVTQYCHLAMHMQ